LRHLDSFWGQAALVSGLLMMVTGMLVLRAQQVAIPSAAAGPPPPRAWRIALLLGLLASFLLYGVTLVQLNLGYPIIGA
jgi:hypothetical protein